MATNTSDFPTGNEPSSKLDDDDATRVRHRPPSSGVVYPMDIDVNSVPTSEGDRSSLQHSISSQDESSLKIPKSFSFLAPSTRLGCCIVVGLLLRIILLAFSVWQDENRWPDGQLRFTDVDYDVFSDASRALIRGDNIYEARPTYRYSPLIAAIVAPGFMFSPTHTAKQPVDSETESFFYPPLIRLSPLTKSNQDPLLAKIWGKLVFIFADIVCAWLQFEVIRTESTVLFKHKTAGHTETTAVWLICLGWLFNPVTAVVSVRGNAEAVLGVCILGCLLLVIRKCALFAGVLFGLCVHLKLYPIIYAPSIYLWLLPFTKNHSPLSLKRRLWLLLPRWPHVWFGIGAITSLGGLTYLGYLYFGGYCFLHQAYFYHFTRVDIKHNFAPHFYPLYLLSGLEWRQSGLTESGTISDILPIGTARRLYSRLQNTISSLMYNSNEAQEPLSSVFHFTIQSILQDAFQLRLMKLAFSLASVLPSIILICFLAFRLRLKPGLCWFTTTFAFVTFNKVCTSQYFLWSLVLLPIALASIRPTASTSIGFMVIENLLIWFGSQALWLATAYSLELHTIESPQFARTVWLMLWMASLFFLLCNVLLLRRFIRWADTRDLDEADAHASATLEEKKER